MSHYESTGWRDEWISRRHRTRGYNVPATDVDFLLIEYDACRPVAVIDYKHAYVAKPDANSAALAALGDRAGLPAFNCTYSSDEPPSFSLFGLNQLARSWLAHIERLLGRGPYDETTYRAALLVMRMREPEASALLGRPLRSTVLVHDR